MVKKHEEAAEQAAAATTAGNGGDGSPSGPQNDADEAAVERDLQADLDQARAEAAEHYERLLRAQAELQNVLKRHERERAERAKYAIEPLARDLLATVDDLERALSHAEDEPAALAAGVSLVYRALLDVLGKHGVERIESVGRPFDPNLHEAVSVVEREDVPDNTIVEEHRPGYRLHDRLLRPAMVVVARAPQGNGQAPA